MAKLDLPNSNSIGVNNLTNESSQYNYLYSLVPRSSTGDISFTSSSSNVVYATATYSAGKFANQGQVGMLSILTEILANNLVTASDFNSKLDNTNFTQTTPYAVDSGLANAYIVILSPVPTSYTDGMSISVKISNTSTGTSTINVNSLGVKPIVNAQGNAIASGDLKANIIYTMRYESISGSFIIQGSSGASGGGNPLTNPNFWIG